MRGKEILFRKKELLKRKESLRLRQQIISMVIKKWTENEINDFINSNSNLMIHTEEEIKNIKDTKVVKVALNYKAV